MLEALQSNTECRVLELCDLVRQASFDLHKFLRHGHLEKVYENGLATRLRKLGVHVVQQHPLAVCNEDGTELGHYFADLFIENQLIGELKAAIGIAREHIAQVLGYLRACNMEHALLINFGEPRLFIKKLILSTP